MKIAVLLTTFNRRQKTLSCLASLYAQEFNQPVSLEVFLTDDASSDGTAEAVKFHYPSVHVFNGTGQFFWAGGMRYTWKKALVHRPDFYLLLNDDTELEPNALQVLVDHVKHAGQPGICIGCTVDRGTGIQSYGGSRLLSSVFWKSEMVRVPDNYTPCDFGNANIMLVAKEVVESIGILSDGYTHGLADYDYSLKAKRAGFDVLVAPGFLGSCVDDHGNNWKSQGVPLKERIKYLKSPKGLAYDEYLLFIRRHFPLSFPSAFFKLWLKTLFPVLWDAFKKPSAPKPILTHA